MSIRFRIYRDLGLVCAYWTTVSSDKKLLKAYKDLYEHPHWSPGFHEFSDLRDCSIRQLTAPGFRTLSALCAGYSEGKCEMFKSAVIVPDDLSYGLTRLYEIAAHESPEAIQVFKTPEDALAWIGIAPEDLETKPFTELICAK